MLKYRYCTSRIAEYLLRDACTGDEPRRGEPPGNTRDKYPPESYSCAIRRKGIWLGDSDLMSGRGICGALYRPLDLESLSGDADGGEIAARVTALIVQIIIPAAAAAARVTRARHPPRHRQPPMAPRDECLSTAIRCFWLPAVSIFTCLMRNHNKCIRQSQ